MKHSKFFKAAGNGPWKEGREGTMTFNDCEPDEFKTFCDFLYTGQVFTIGVDDTHEVKEAQEAPKDPGKKPTISDKEMTRAARLWCLGQKLLSTSFKDAVVDALIAKCVAEFMYPTSMHLSIYAAGSSTSAIRRLLVDFMVWSLHAKTIEWKGYDAIAAEYYYDVLVAKGRMTGDADSNQAPFKQGNTCRYHEHVAEGKPCYMTMF